MSTMLPSTINVMHQIQTPLRNPLATVIAFERNRVSCTLFQMAESSYVMSLVSMQPTFLSCCSTREKYFEAYRRITGREIFLS